MRTKPRTFALLSLLKVEDFVPPNHFYRLPERTLDLAFVRDLYEKRDNGTDVPYTFIITAMWK